MTEVLDRPKASVMANGYHSRGIHLNVPYVARKHSDIITYHLRWISPLIARAKGMTFQFSEGDK